MSENNSQEIFVEHIESMEYDQRTYKLGTLGLINGGIVMYQGAESLIDLSEDSLDLKRMRILGAKIMLASGVEYVTINDDSVCVGKNFLTHAEDLKWKDINSAVLSEIQKFVNEATGQENSFEVISKPSNLEALDDEGLFDNFEEVETEEPEEA